MGKSRRKQLRKITVGGIEYKWLVEDTNCSCGLNLKIWDNKKKILFDDIIRRIKDVEEVTLREVTPAFVKKVIIDIDWIETK